MSQVMLKTFAEFRTCVMTNQEQQDLLKINNPVNKKNDFTELYENESYMKK